MVDDLFNDAAEPLIGRKLDGRYEVLGRLGDGGAGVVYRGRQAHLDRFVAIKVLHQETAASPEWRRRFEREARALSALAHPNIVPVADFGIDRGVPFLVMELLEGKTLGALLKEEQGQGPLPLRRVLDIARQMLRGLAFAHGKGIVHRDLKPANVFLQALPDHDDHVRLLDFGMVKFLEGSSSRPTTELTSVGAMIGTPAYMSPEQVKGGAIDARTDVYAAGALLFELLAGQRPFVSDSAEGYLGAHLTQPIPSLVKVRPGVAGAALFQAVIARAMAKNPVARFRDAAAMLAALEQVAAHLPVEALSGERAEAAKKPAPPAHRAAAPSDPRVWRYAAILVTLVGGIAAGALYLRRDRAKPVEIAALPAQPPPQQALPSPAPTPTPTPVPTPTPAVPAEQAPASPAKSATTTTPTTTPTPAPSSLPPPPAPNPEPSTAPPAEAKAPAEKPAPTETPGPPKQQQPEAEANVAANTAANVATNVATNAAPGARDPWLEPVPHALRPIHDRVSRGVRMSQRALVPAYEFAHENPDDPRPWLLLGRAYAQLDWLSDSVDRYLRAYHVDSTCRGDPQMLADLLKATVHPVAGRGATRAIRTIYGPEAIPALEKDLERLAGDREATARLARLRESISR